MRSLSLTASLLLVAALPLGAATKSTSLNDDFNGRKSDWVWLGTDDTTVSKLDRGILRWHNTSTDEESVQTTKTEIELGLRNDYELSVRMRMAKSAFANGWIGFRWAMDSDGENYYQFELDPENEVRLDVVRNNTLTRLIDWRASPTIKAGEFNTFTIRQVGLSLYLYANDQLIAVGPSRDLSGGTFALRIDGGVEAEYDFVHTRALPPAEAAATVADFDALLRARPDAVHPMLETFDNNDRDWLGVGDKDESFGEIADGVFHYENLQLEADSERFSGLINAIDDQRNFAVEMRLRFVSGVSDRTFGLTIGRDGDTSARHYFDLTNSQTFRAGIYDGSSWTTVLPRTEAKDLIKADDYNTLSIQSVGRTTYYLINGRVVGTANRTPYLGRSYGFSVSSGVTVDVDDYRISYLPQSADATAAQIARLDDSFREFQIAHGPSIEPWIDPFDDASSGWFWTGSSEGRSYIFADGVLTCDNQTDQGMVELLKKPINEEVDYDLRLTFTHLKGPTNSGMGLVWGRTSDGDSAMKFLVAPDGHYRLDNIKHPTNRYPIEWTKTTLYRPNAANELLVRKVGNRLFLFLNGQLLADGPATPLEGTSLGMQISSKQTVAFDEISLTYHPRPGAESQAEFARLDAELAAAYRAKQIVGVVHQPTFRAEQRAKIHAEIEAQRLDDKDEKQHKKVYAQFHLKPLLSVQAAWGKAFKVHSPTPSMMYIYYKYREKGGLQYYYQFTAMCIRGDPKDLGNYHIENVWLTSDLPKQ